MAVAAMMACVCECAAQKNPFGINSECYKMYADIYSRRTQPEALEVAQKMYNLALQKRDGRAACAAMTLPVSYYFYQDDERMFYRAVQDLQDLSLKYGCEDLYYYGVSNKVNYMLNRKQFAKARHYLNDVEAGANKRGHRYGLYTCLTALAQVSLSTREVNMAISYLNQALKITEELNMTRLRPDIYRKFTACYEDLYMYDKMYEYGVLAYDNSYTPMQKQRALYAICYSAAMLGMDDEFKKHYALYEELRHKVNPDSKEFEEQTLAILNMLYNGQYDEAYKRLKDKKNSLRYMRLLAEYYRRTNDYKSLAETQTDLYHRQIIYSDDVLQENYDDMYARFFNFQLGLQNQMLLAERQQTDSRRKAAELKNTNLQLANTQLTLRNSSLELARTKSESKLLRLSYDRKQLEAARLKGRIVATQTQNDFSNMISVLGFIVGFILFVGIGIYLKVRASFMVDLQETNTMLTKTNHELTEAKNHAETANSVKTRFFDSMSDEIRLPLDTIVHLSRQIAELDKDAPQERLHELSQQIGSNTATLLNIVDDVLKKTHS